MGKSLPFALLAALAACVTPEAAPNPRGAVAPGQRLIVLVYQSPGPWIVADPDSKAESALKLLPLGNFLQGMQEDRVNELSKEIQPYLPRPHYAAAVEEELIAKLKTLHDGPVLTAAEAGIDPRQRRDWNSAADQLDWRRKYFNADPGRAARDYSKLLSLDDAVIVDVNLSFGLEPDEQDRTLPVLSAATRLYRADTSRLLASREDLLSDKTSSATLTEFRASPADLTDRIYAMSKPLGGRIAGMLASTLGLRAPASPPPSNAPAAVFSNGRQPGLQPPGAPAMDLSTSTVVAASTQAVTASSAPPAAAAPPSVSTEPATAASPAPAAPPSASTPTATTSPATVSP